MARRFAASPRSARAISAWALTGHRSTGARPTFLVPAKCWCSAMSSTRAARRMPPTFAACSRPMPTSSSSARTTPSTPPTRLKAFSSTASKPSAIIMKPRSSITSIPAATITRCPAIRCAPSSTPPPKCSAPMGFQNEKDHPEVAPSQFEINYAYSEVVNAADQIQLYKLICRQVATKMGFTASFLPKPVVGVNGSGMHTNVSVSKKGKNLFWDAKGEEKLSKMGWAFVDRILTHGNDLCLMLNASVNAYRRLDPHFEAPNQLKASAVDRGSMIRIPIGNEKSMRVEVRSVSPDANPYMVMLSVFKTGLFGETAKIKNLRQAERYLPDNIYDALENWRKSEWTPTPPGTDVKARYGDLKQASADRCARLLGTFVKAPEVQHHHDVYNQYLWNQF